MDNTRFGKLLREKILRYKPDFNLDILEIGLEKFILSEYKSGDYLVKAGHKCKNLFILENSITRSYFIGDDGEEKTLWIEPETSFITDYESFSSDQASLRNIRLYHDSFVFHISREELVNLYRNHHEWTLLGIIIIEEHFINLLRLRTTLNFNDASENYKLVELYYSQYLEVVPMKHLASWLNISPVHLSRIRKENQKKKIELTNVKDF